MSELKTLRSQGIAERSSRLKAYGGSNPEEVQRVTGERPAFATGGAVKARAMGGMVGGEMGKPRLDKKSHGGKKKSATTVNVIIAPQGDGAKSEPSGPAMPPPDMAGGPPMPMPGPGGPPMPPMPMPMRKAGGAVKADMKMKAKMPKVDDGAGGGMGRLEKAGKKT